MRCFSSAQPTSTARRPNLPPLRPASTKLAKFLSGVLGGPPLFAQEFGPPRMRQRHVPFPIDERAKNVWFHTFRDVLEARAEEFKVPREHLPGFLRWLEDFADWMINVKPGP